MKPSRLIIYVVVDDTFERSYGYPNGGLQGGGPQCLREITADEAIALYGDKAEHVLKSLGNTVEFVLSKRVASANARFKFMLSSVCSQPSHFTGQADFKAVVFWLKGYNDALHPPTVKRRLRLGFDGFADWLVLKFPGVDPVAHVPDWADYLRLLYPDDEDALKHLPDLFDEFVQSLPTQ